MPYPAAIDTFPEAAAKTSTKSLKGTLASTITSGATTITLNQSPGSLGAPNSGVVVLEDERIRYTGVSGNNLTGCTRGYGGSTAAGHNAGVYCRFYAVPDHVNEAHTAIVNIENFLGPTGAHKVVITDGTVAQTATGVKSFTHGIRVGTNSASTGLVNLPNDSAIYARNAGNSADIAVIKLNASNQVEIVQPLIADFTNAQHNHQGAAGGGTLDAAAIAAGNLALARLPVGSANQLLKTNSGATAQEHATLAVGSSGSDFAVAFGAGTITLNLPDASATARGVITTGTQTIAGVKTFTSGIKVGTNPASTGLINLPNNSAVFGRNAANSADVAMIKVNASDQVEMTVPLVGVSASLTYNDSGTGLSQGLYISATSSNPSATKTYLLGVNAECYDASAGDVSNIYPLITFVSKSGAGTAATVAGLRVQTNVKSAGTITDNHGILVDDQTVGANNWAIKTGLGLVQFGNQEVRLRRDSCFLSFYNTAGTQRGYIQISEAGEMTVLQAQSQPIKFYTASALRATLDNAGAWIPATTGNDLGTTSLRWDVFAGAIDGSGLCKIVQPTIETEVLRLESEATNDNPNFLVLHGRNVTTDTTITQLFGYALAASNTYLIEARVVARRTGGSAGTAEDGAGYALRGTYKMVGGVATLIGAVSVIYSAEDQAGWDATLSPTSNVVRVLVTGATNNNIVWHCTVFVQNLGT